MQRKVWGALLVIAAAAALAIAGTGPALADQIGPGGHSPVADQIGPGGS